MLPFRRRLVPDVAGLMLGKPKPTIDARDFRLRNYLDAPTLPPLPRAFGHSTVLPADGWGMYANDQVGDCVIAGAGHEHELWTRESPTVADASFSDDEILAAYSAITGYVPGNPGTDNGTDMRAAADWRRKVGLVDTAGQRHSIAAYARLSAGNLTELAYAIFLFGAAGIGVEWPASGFDQFRRGVPLDYVRGSPIEGGHYIVGAGRQRNGNYRILTWGCAVTCTPRFLGHYMDEGLVYFSREVLTADRSPEGFRSDQLATDLAAL